MSTDPRSDDNVPVIPGSLDPSCGSAESMRHLSKEDQVVQEDRGRVWDDLTRSIIGGCIEVHRQVGPGLLESVYELCLYHELGLRGLRVERQKSVPLLYKGVRVASGFRADMIVEERVLLELKAIEQLLPIHIAQTATYLRLADLEVALLVNFNVAALRRGLRSIDRNQSWISRTS